MNPIVFYDGECNFCNHWVQWIVKHDAERIFRFASLQSNFAKDMFSHFGREIDLSTIFVYTKEGEFLSKSKAVSYIFQQLKIRSVFSRILKITPRFLSDTGYGMTAAFRKRLKNSCTAFMREEKELFLNSSRFSEWYANNSR